MRIHREGYPTLILVGTVLALLNVFTWQGRYRRVILAASALFWGFFAQFFRHPHRTTPTDSEAIIAPADGIIVDIQHLQEPEYFGEERLKISIYLSALNVHVNRVPVAGKVLYTKYHPGKYLVAFHPKASTLNEHATLVLQDANGREVLVRQIAGLLARRIVTYLGEGQTVQAGQELGFIKFGSRVDIFLPPEARSVVEHEQRVKGGETILANFS